MLKLCFCLLFCIQITSTVAQNHLEPAGDLITYNDSLVEYYSKVRKKLFSGLSENPEIRFFVMPSFAGELVLDIEENQKTGKYQLVLHQCEKNIWTSKNKDDIKIVKIRKEITEASVHLLHKLYLKAISLVRYPQETIIGNNSTMYYFMALDFTIRCGTIWSPDKGTNMGELVNISEEIIKLELNTVEPIDFDNVLKKRINDLLLKLK